MLLAIFGYLLLQLLICVLVMRRMSSEQDYLLAGRSLNLPLTTMTIFATWFGAETCIGAAGAIYADGLAGGRIDPFGYALCIFFMGLFFARRLWARGLTTLGDFFRQRYGQGVEKLAVVLMVPASVLWAAAQILAFGHVLSAASTLTVNLAIAFAALIVIAYTTLGGLLADVVSDFVQGVVLVLGLLLLLAMVLLNLPDVDAFAIGFAGERLTLRTPGESWLAVIDGWSIPLIGSLFAAELVTRVLASSSAEVARCGALLGGTLYLVVGFIPLVLGMLGPALLPGLTDPEQLLPLLARDYLPPVLFVVFAGALVSAILSTVDSALLAAGSLVSHNLVLPLLPGIDERHKVRIARTAVAGFGVIAYLLAINADSVLGLVEEASAFGSAGIFTCCVLGLTQHRGGALTATVTLLTGMISYGVLAYLLQFDYAYLASLGAALSAYLLVMTFESAVPAEPTALQANA